MEKNNFEHCIESVDKVRNIAENIKIQLLNENKKEDIGIFTIVDDLCKASCARCARVSHKLFDGTTSITKDIELFNRLKNAGHWSPLEFVAVACNAKDYKLSNYKGYNQYRRFYN